MITVVTMHVHEGPQAGESYVGTVIGSVPEEERRSIAVRYVAFYYCDDTCDVSHETQPARTISFRETEPVASVDLLTEIENSSDAMEDGFRSAGAV